LYIAGCIAVLLAASPGLPALVYVAILASIALTVAVVGDCIFGPPITSLVLRRLPVKHLALRVPATIAYELENHSSRTVNFGIAESPLRTLRFGITAEAAGTVVAQSRALVSQSAIPVARGADELGNLYLWYENVFGLLRRRVRMNASQAIRVYPDLSAVERYGALHVRNRLIEAGLRRMRLRGIGTEFESLREWSIGDAFRAIDWKATARRGKIMVAQHEIERSQNVMIVLDCGRLMTPRVQDQRKLDFAVTAALSVASIAGLANDRVGVVAFAREILAASAPRATRSSIAQLSDLLYDLEPRFEESDYARAFNYLRSHLHKRSLIVFFTDVIDPLAQSLVLAELGTLARRHLVICAFMNDEAIEKTLALDFQTIGAHRENQPGSDVMNAYRTAVALGLQHERRAAAATLSQRGIIVIDVPARKLTTALIDGYLRVKQRGLL
jgi:uncharacterized protein (DUF58 family)